MTVTVAAVHITHIPNVQAKYVAEDKKNKISISEKKTMNDNIANGRKYTQLQ